MIYVLETLRFRRSDSEADIGGGKGSMQCFIKPENTGRQASVKPGKYKKATKGQKSQH